MDRHIKREDKIKKAISDGYNPEYRAGSDYEVESFMGGIKEEIEKTIKERFPYIETVKNVDKVKIAEDKLLSNMKLKGYMFDSLVFRYKDARYAQARYEAFEDEKIGNNSGRAMNRADRDFMRFIQILDEAIGAHE